MSERAEQGKRRRAWVMIAALVIALPVVYVASYGPVVAYLFSIDQYRLGYLALETVYAPLLYAAEFNETASRLLQQYGAWWLENVF